MATNENSTVIAPNIPSDSPLPKSPKLSPQPSSSSDSFDSSLPKSQGSSATSRSISSSPIPKSGPTIDSHESIEHSNLSLIPPRENTSLNQLQRQNDPQRSVPPAPAENPRTTHKTSWRSYLGYLIPKRNCFPHSLSAITLGLTLVGMVTFEWWTYQLTKIATCGQLISANVSLGDNCRDLLKNNTGDVKPRNRYVKRAWNAIANASYRLRIENDTKVSIPPNGGFGRDTLNLRYFDFWSIAVVIASTVIIGGLSLIIFRHYWMTEEVFTSPVKSDWHVTRHHEEGPETVTGEGYRMIRRNPDDGHPLGQLRQHIRSSQPNAVENPTGEHKWQSTSEETLVGPWKDTKLGNSKVSLIKDDSTEKHENLIELETEGPNKTFFDPETGEFIHLTPWKSTGDEEIHGLKPDGKGSIKRAFAQMTLGATGWAGGKGIDDRLAEELQANSKRVEKELVKPEAGDSTTGNKLLQAPSGKPPMA